MKMTKIDRLETTVKSTYGTDSVVLDSTDAHAIIRFTKSDTTEYAVIRHDYDSVHRGKYFAAIGQTLEEARQHAWDAYNDII